MKLFASLDPKDRRMLLIILGMVAVLLVVVAFFTPADDPDQGNIPDSNLVGKHGARAAFTLLQQSGYAIERWEQPLHDLASHSGPGTVLILAGPVTWQPQDRVAISDVLKKGGRVLATGTRGGILLPGNEINFAKTVSFAACEAKPDGFSPLATAGSIWIEPESAWSENAPEFQTAYTCGGQPVVVAYPVGKGTAIWWAGSTPLENGSISRGANLELLLNSIGPAQGQHIYWDESLHTPPPSQWDFVSGPVWPLFFWGSIGVALLVVFSFSRRSGPVRALPQAPRTTPIEFLDALGSLYRSTGANATAVQIAWERFRSQAALLTGQRTSQLDARELFAAIIRRFGSAASGMEADLVAAEEACWDESLKPRHALALVQSLRRHEETLRQASSKARSNTPAIEGVTLGT